MQNPNILTTAFSVREFLANNVRQLAAASFNIAMASFALYDISANWRYLPDNIRIYLIACCIIDFPIGLITLTCFLNEKKRLLIFQYMNIISAAINIFTFNSYVWGIIYEDVYSWELRAIIGAVQYAMLLFAPFCMITAAMKKIEENEANIISTTIIHAQTPSNSVNSNDSRDASQSDLIQSAQSIRKQSIGLELKEIIIQ